MKNLLVLCLALIAGLETLLAHPGVGIVENSQGEIFFTDLKQVWKISQEGKLTLAVAGVHTHELFLDADDNLYGEHLWYNGDVKNTWGHYVWKLSRQGVVTKVIPETEGFLENYSFVRDHVGNMYWADRTSDCQKIVRRNRDRTVSPVSNACFHNIRKIEALADGSVALVDFQDLKKVDSRGNVQTIATRIANKNWKSSTPDNQNSVMGIWADREGRLYAAVSSARVVKRFGTDGQEKIVYRSPLTWSPSGGCVDSRGRLWILEYNLVNAVRVTRVDDNGKETVFNP